MCSSDLISYSVKLTQISIHIAANLHQTITCAYLIAVIVQNRDQLRTRRGKKFLRHLDDRLVVAAGGPEVEGTVASRETTAPRRLMAFLVDYAFRSSAEERRFR